MEGVSYETPSYKTTAIAQFLAFKITFIIVV